MTVFGVLRGFTFLARDVFEAALYLIPAPGLSGDDVDGAELLAEQEARVDVTEPLTREEALGPYHAFGWLENYSEWPDSESALLMEPPLTADELVAVRQLIEERFTHAPVASASPPTPADATGYDPTLANDPASVHERQLRRMFDDKFNAVLDKAKGEDRRRP